MLTNLESNSDILMLISFKDLCREFSKLEVTDFLSTADQTCVTLGFAKLSLKRGTGGAIFYF